MKLATGWHPGEKYFTRTSIISKVVGKDKKGEPICKTEFVVVNKEFRKVRRKRELEEAKKKAEKGDK